MGKLSHIWKLSKQALLPMVTAWKMQEKTAYKIEPETLKVDDIVKIVSKSIGFPSLYVNDIGGEGRVISVMRTLRDFLNAGYSSEMMDLWEKQVNFTEEYYDVRLLSSSKEGAFLREDLEKVDETTASKTAYKIEPDELKVGDRVRCIVETSDSFRLEGDPLFIGKRITGLVGVVESIDEIQDYDWGIFRIRPTKGSIRVDFRDSGADNYDFPLTDWQKYLEIVHDEPKLSYKTGLQVGDVLTFDEIIKPGILQEGQVWHTNRDFLDDCGYSWISISSGNGVVNVSDIIMYGGNAGPREPYVDITNSVYNQDDRYKQSNYVSCLYKNTEPFTLVSKDNKRINRRSYIIEPEGLQVGDVVKLAMTFDEIVDLLEVHHVKDHLDSIQMPHGWTRRLVPSVEDVARLFDRVVGTIQGINGAGIVEFPYTVEFQNEYVSDICHVFDIGFFAESELEKVDSQRQASLSLSYIIEPEVLKVGDRVKLVMSYEELCLELERRYSHEDGGIFEDDEGQRVTQGYVAETLVGAIGDITAYMEVLTYPYRVEFDDPHKQYWNNRLLGSYEYTELERLNQYQASKTAYRIEPEGLKVGDRVELISDYTTPPASDEHPIRAGTRGTVTWVTSNSYDCSVIFDNCENPYQWDIDLGGEGSYVDDAWYVNKDELRKIDDRPTRRAAKNVIYGWADPDGEVTDVGGDFHNEVAYRIVREKFPKLFEKAQEKLNAGSSDFDSSYAEDMLLQMGWVRIAGSGVTIGVPFNQARRSLEGFLANCSPERDVYVEKYFYDAFGYPTTYQHIFNGRASELLDEIVHNGSRLDYLEVTSYKIEPDVPSRDNPQSWVGWLIQYRKIDITELGEYCVVWYVRDGKVWGIWKKNKERALEIGSNFEKLVQVLDIILRRGGDVETVASSSSMMLVLGGNDWLSHMPIEDATWELVPIEKVL